MPSNSLPDADLNLPEMKTKSPSCPAGGVHMYELDYWRNLITALYVCVFSAVGAMVRMSLNVLF